MLATPTPITAPSGTLRSPKPFQTALIDNLVAALSRSNQTTGLQRPPCLLRSPTGSGKTFVLTRVLQQISSQTPVLWLWFVPFVNLVAQTIDALDADALGLQAVPLPLALNEQPAPSLVLLSTVQGVASAKARKSGYTSAEDDDRRSIASYVARVRSAGIAIGLVVDEAHIAMDSGTEFGQFVHWLAADYLLMASATPKDQRLSQFIDASGYGHYETFSVSRAEVVAARLNKQWLEAVVYPLRESMQSVTDLRLTVLRRAWRRNQQIARQLQALGLATVPLLLVQVANGKEAMQEAYEFLQRDLKILPHAIGLHSADEPDPVLMAAIANDSTKQVLVFKQSAGVGFDAPRAFVLASTKHVNAPDFATQFIGRIMRVPLELQQAFPDAAQVPAELNTAYVFLANEASQPGFAQAAQAIQGVQTQFAGQIEQLVARATAFGGVALTNRPTAQAPLLYDLGLLRTRSADGTVQEPLPSTPDGAADTLWAALPPGASLGLFDAADDGALDSEGLDAVLQAEAPRTPQPRPRAPQTRAELFAALAQAEIQTLPRRTALAQRSTPERLMTEVQPALEALALDVNQAAQRLAIDSYTQANAVKAAMNRMTEKEIRTELFGGSVTEGDVQVVTDQHALLDITRDKLATLGLEEQDCTDVISALALRLIEAVEQAWALQDDDARPAPAALRSQARQAACWVIHKQFPELQEALHTQWATRARLDLAQPLPDALLLPASMPVQPSRKNLYGVLFPQTGEVAAARAGLPPEARRLLKNETYVYGQAGDVGEIGAVGDITSLACVDGAYEFNHGELKLAQALDLADFVVWWHRNPQGKPHSVGLLRGDSKNLFYPDFVVCLTHMPGDEPLLRLIDPKFDTKDARRKAIHVSPYYGKVLFLSEDAKRFKIVQDNGSLGDVVDYGDLARLKTWMRSTQPLAQTKNA